MAVLDPEATEVVNDLSEAIRSTFDSEFTGIPDAVVLFKRLVDQGWLPPKGRVTFLERMVT